MTREEARREIDSLDFYLQNHTDDYSEESHAAMVMAIQALEQEEVVRCKECKHCEKRYDGTDKPILYMCEDDHCNDGTVGCEMVVEPNFFCAYGEK